MIQPDGGRGRTLEIMAMGEWRPISTAPKDGTIIVLAQRYDVVAGRWDSAENERYPWRFLDNTIDGLNGYEEGARGPTHWMPLPEPPQ
jgi:hypothetical protein